MRGRLRFHADRLVGASRDLIGRDLIGQGLMQNALALWGVQAFRKALPLIVLPFLARVLGPTGWGLVAIFQSFAAAVVLLIEFGFRLSGTREVAQSRHSKRQLADIFAGVLGAQLILAACAAAFVWFISHWIPVLRNNPALLTTAMVLALADGCNPTWYFLGMERMRVVASLEISSKTLATAVMFVVVRSPRDVWVVLALQALPSVVSLVTALCIVYRNIPFHLPSRSVMCETLYRGWSMFLIRSAESLYTMGNAFLLGLFAGPVVAGYFAGAEKISRALSGIFNPVRDTLYPRLSKLIHTSPAQAERLARLGMLVTGLGSLLIGVAIFFSAPLVIRILLGKEFGPSVHVLRILAILPFLISISDSIGVQWLLPLGRERIVGRILLFAGVLNVVLAIIFAPKFAQTGMAWAVVSAEAFVCVSLMCAGAFDRTRPFPFKRHPSFTNLDSYTQPEPVFSATSVNP